MEERAGTLLFPATLRSGIVARLWERPLRICATVRNFQGKCQGRQIHFRVPRCYPSQHMKRRAKSSWREKVHPVFIEACGVYRHSVKQFLALGKNPPADRVQEINTQCQHDLGEIEKRVSGQKYTPAGPDPLDSIFVDLQNASHNQGFMEQLHWQRYAEPLWIAVQKAEEGDLEAIDRVHRTQKDYTRAAFRLGGIKPVKADLDHAGMFDVGLPLGLSTLTAEELADCFDEMCPCGKAHDADALKKQRARRIKAHQEARDWIAAERAKIPAREKMFVFGKDGMWAKASLVACGEPPLVFVGENEQPAACYLDSRGEISFFEDSKIDRASFQGRLPDAFCVGSTMKVFVMFFH